MNSTKASLQSSHLYTCSHSFRVSVRSRFAAARIISRSTWMDRKGTTFFFIIRAYVLGPTLTVGRLLIWGSENARPIVGSRRTKHVRQGSYRGV
jgi:hypothetical protein